LSKRKQIYEKHVEFKNKKGQCEKFIKKINKRAFYAVSDKKIITSEPGSQKKYNKTSEHKNS